MSKVDMLAVALFEAYSRNSGSPPNCHYDRNAAEQWMAQALDECGVAGLIETSRALLTYRQGTYPVGGWLRDNGASRAQLDALATALENIGSTK